MSSGQEHTLLWNDRLQDWLDGDVADAEAAIVEQHVNSCEHCQAQLAAFQELDAKLRSATPPIALDASFDGRLFAQIDTIDEAQRAAARRRIEQELQENLTALSRSWRRTLAFVLPGVVAGVVLAFTLSGYFLSSDIAEPLVEGAENISGNLELIHAVLTTLLGAAVGATVARWLASVAE